MVHFIAFKVQITIYNTWAKRTDMILDICLKKIIYGSIVLFLIIMVICPAGFCLDIQNSYLAPRLYIPKLNNELSKTAKNLVKLSLSISAQEEQVPYNAFGRAPTRMVPRTQWGQNPRSLVLIVMALETFRLIKIDPIFKTLKMDDVFIIGSTGTNMSTISSDIDGRVLNLSPPLDNYFNTRIRKIENTWKTYLGSDKELFQIIAFPKSLFHRLYGSVLTVPEIQDTLLAERNLESGLPPLHISEQRTGWVEGAVVPLLEYSIQQLQFWEANDSRVSTTLSEYIKQIERDFNISCTQAIDNNTDLLVRISV